jgi:hypothetical protein
LKFTWKNIYPISSLVKFHTIFLKTPQWQEEN